MQTRYAVLRSQIKVAEALVVAALPRCLPRASTAEFATAVVSELRLRRDLAWVSDVAGVAKFRENWPGTVLLMIRAVATLLHVQLHPVRQFIVAFVFGF
jgi:hypothetical protein